MWSVISSFSNLGKAVNPGNADLDVSALDQFCMTIKNDPKLMALAPQLLATRIQSGNSREALLALEVSWSTF